MLRNSLIYHYLYYATSKNKHLKQRMSLLVGIAFVFLYFIDGKLLTNENISELGLISCGYIVRFLIYFTTFFVPMWASSTIENEKQNGTFPLLLLSGYSFARIIWHKYLAFLFLFSAHLLGTLPLFLFCVVMGGISADQILAIYGVIFVFIAFAVSVSFSMSIMFSSISPLVVSMAFTILVLLLTIVDYFYFHIFLLKELDYIARGQISIRYFILLLSYFVLSIIILKCSTGVVKNIFYRETKTKLKKAVDYFTSIVTLKNVDSYYDTANYILSKDKRQKVFKVTRLVSFCLIAVIILISLFIILGNFRKYHREILVLFTILLFYITSFLLLFSYTCLSLPFSKNFELILLTKTSAKQIVNQKYSGVYAHFDILSVAYILILFIGLVSRELLIFLCIFPLFAFPFLHLCISIALYYSLGKNAFHKVFLFSCINIVAILVVIFFVSTFFVILVPPLIFLIILGLPIMFLWLANFYKKMLISKVIDQTF